MAVLVLISLVSHFVNHSGNILGQYLGTALATGMIFLFGRVPCFVFPGVIGYIGWLRLRGDSVSYRNLIVGAVLIFEVCVLLAIPALPLLAAGTPISMFDANWLGISIVKILKTFFGSHPFGPYFLTSLALVVTVLVSLRISPVRLIKAIVAISLWVASHLAALFHKSKAALEREEAERQKKLAEAAAAEPDPAKQPRGRSRKQAPAGGVVAAGAAVAVVAATAEAAAPVESAEKVLNPVEEESGGSSNRNWRHSGQRRASRSRS